MVYNLRQGGQGRAHRRDDVEQWLKDIELVIQSLSWGTVFHANGTASPRAQKSGYLVCLRNSKQASVAGAE